MCRFDTLERCGVHVCYLISGFCHDVDEISVLVGYYTA